MATLMLNNPLGGFDIQIWSNSLAIWRENQLVIARNDPELGHDPDFNHG